MQFLLKLTLSVLTASFSIPAYSLDGDLFTVNLGASYLYDDNLFRQPKDSNILGVTKRWDTILSTSLGIDIDKKYSMQAIAFQFKHNNNKYQNNSYLDYDTNNYTGSWNFSITPNIKGLAYIDSNESIISFADTTNNQLNLRTQQTKSFDVDYSTYGNWHLIGGYVRDSIKNSSNYTIQQPFEMDSFRLGAKYVFASETSIKFIAKKGDAQTGQALDPSILLDSGYKEQTQELIVVWPMRLKSKFDFNLGYLKRDYDNFAARNYSGYYGGLTYLWSITHDVDFLTGYSRQIDNYQLSASNYVITDRLYLNPLWHITSKLDMALNAEMADRSYKGAGYAQSLIERDDKIRKFGASLFWSPRKELKLGLNAQHEIRKSNAAGLDYDDNLVGVNLRLIF